MLDSGFEYKNQTFMIQKVQRISIYKDLYFG